MKPSRTMLLLLMLLVSSSLALPAIAGDPEPFKAKATVFTPEFDYAAGLFANVGTGEGTPMGWFMMIHHNHSKYQADIYPAFPSEGTLTLTTANGDQLHMNTVGVYHGDTGLETDQFVITGGTGRFKDATGQGVITEAFHNAPDPHIFTFEGTVQLK